MPTVTFLSDFGYRDHYVAAVKARILKDCPTATIVDISHGVGNGNIGEAGYLLKSVYNDFPKGTIHLVSVGAASHPNRRLIAAVVDGHYFVGGDNGFISLLSALPPEQVYLLPEVSTDLATFPSKYIMAPAVAELANGTSLSDLGDPTDNFEQKLFSPLRKTANEIHGQVIHVDGYGNLITNIDWKGFSDIGKGRAYTIRCGYERFSSTSQFYSSKDYGDCVLIFNSAGLLEVAINHGNASELLGMNYNSTVMIQFVGD